MNKGQVIKFSDLKIGDFFSDNERQRYRKIPEYTMDFELPNLQTMAINAFHIQTNAVVSVNTDDEFIFIAHSIWNPDEHRKQFEFSTEKLELEHQIEFFTNYFEILKVSLSGVETSDDFFDLDESFNSFEVDEFINLMRSSFFISLYSYLEAQLNKECQLSQQDNTQIKILLNDIHGSGIDRAKTYLVKVLDTSFPFDKDLAWKEIQLFGKLRNCIVHADGKVKDSNLEKYIENHPDLHCEMIFGDDIVVLDEGFCEKAIAVISAFLHSLLYYRQADKVG
jgi:hypothetical protein